MNVCACKWVDEVIIGAPMTVTEDLVKTWDIHVVAKGAGHKRNSGEPKDDPRLLGTTSDFCAQLFVSLSNFFSYCECERDVSLLARHDVGRPIISRF